MFSRVNGWARFQAKPTVWPILDLAVPALQRVRRVTRMRRGGGRMRQACAVVNASPMFAARHSGIRSSRKALGAIDRALRFAKMVRRVPVTECSVREAQRSPLRFSKSRLNMTPTGRRMFEVAKRLVKNEDGAALIEYGMLVMLDRSALHRRDEDNRKQSRQRVQLGEYAASLRTLDFANFDSTSRLNL